MTLRSMLLDFLDADDERVSRAAIAQALARDRVERTRFDCADIGSQAVLARMRAREEALRFRRRA